MTNAIKRVQVAQSLVLRNHQMVVGVELAGCFDVVR